MLLALVLIVCQLHALSSGAAVKLLFSGHDIDPDEGPDGWFQNRDALVGGSEILLGGKRDTDLGTGAIITGRAGCMPTSVPVCQNKPGIEY